jgi:hypothetical protein
MLRSVERYKGGYCRTTGLKILARCGLIEMEPRPDDNGFYRALLTEAGVEALERSRKRRGR